MGYDNGISMLSIKELLSQDTYRIPRYQRNFSWTTEDVSQLLQDIAESAQKQPVKNYYLGTLVTARKDKSKNIFETVDGQQRLTALTIILCAIKHLKNCGVDFASELTWFNKINLSFEQRNQSKNLLNSIFENPDIVEKNSTSDAEEFKQDSIWAAYITASIQLRNRIEGKKGQKTNPSQGKVLLEYLLNKVFLLRTELPKGTELNRYFEVMNNRGLQLEPQEIVKARLISYLEKDPEQRNQEVFNQIWEACSQMNKYVVEAFPPESRTMPCSEEELFLSKVKDFKELTNVICDSRKEKSETVYDLDNASLEALLYQAKEKPRSYPEEEKGSSKQPTPEYTSLIDFPNFLLLVLKIMSSEKQKTEEQNIALNDKRLIDTFDEVLELEKDKNRFSKEFARNLLYLRFLFDKFIIKRHENTWSLDTLSYRQKGEKQEKYFKATFSEMEGKLGGRPIPDPCDRIIKLQSMFHVSSPSPTYKYWMYAALRFIFRYPAPDAKKFESFLWDLGRAFMLDRYLATDNKEDKHTNLQLSFQEIVSNLFNEDTGAYRGEVCKINWANINIGPETGKQPGEAVEHFVFNFFDYLLWKREPKGKKKNFIFAFRNSVEHFYPQHPKDPEKDLSENYLQSFGNLCLVTRGTNSRFSNLMPHQKANAYGSEKKEVGSYSLKLQEIIAKARNDGEWNGTAIKEAEEAAKKMFIEELEKSIPWSYENPET